MEEDEDKEVSKKESFKGKVYRKIKRIAKIAMVLAPLYYFTSGSSEVPVETRYPLPAEIKVVDTDLPYTERQLNSENSELEKIVKVEDIDFSGNFFIETERYTLVKNEDWIESKAIGHVMSIPHKLLFWDWDISWGLDSEKSRTALAILENDVEIKDITVRLNHTEAWYDIDRMFEDDKLINRNPFLSRITLGVGIGLFSEIWCEFTRGDYYNPMTQTAVVYSNVESIFSHEIGHHKDFQRFDTDWEYCLSGSIAPISIYQEGRATSNANEMLSSEDRNQTGRYLLPAFLTYCIGSWYISKKILQIKMMKSNHDSRDIKDVDENERPKIRPLQTLRHLVSWNTQLYAGIATYSGLGSQNLGEALSCVGFLVAYQGTGKIFDKTFGRIAPYDHKIKKIEKNIEDLKD
ncbi:hypothetical protein GOV12_07590 [Candidatus Pacearchaeota archaeon]|nr:hypothetical protein [Candidatus Pacearchaeota archaeon]